MKKWRKYILCILIVNYMWFHTVFYQKRECIDL